MSALCLGPFMVMSSPEPCPSRSPIVQLHACKSRSVAMSKTTKKRSPLVPIDQTPGMSLPVPCAVYPVEPSSIGHVGGTVVLPLRLNPFLYKHWENDTGDFLLRRVDELSEVFDFWGRSVRTPARLSWQVGIVVPCFRLSFVRCAILPVCTTFV